MARALYVAGVLSGLDEKALEHAVASAEATINDATHSDLGYASEALIYNRADELLGRRHPDLSDEALDDLRDREALEWQAAVDAAQRELQQRAGSAAFAMTSYLSDLIHVLGSDISRLASLPEPNEAARLAGARAPDERAAP